MLFNAALFSSLLLSPVVLALPSGLGARIARRGQSSQGNNRPERDIAHEYSDNFAGARLSESSNGTFSSIIGTFVVPSASGTNGSAAIYAGIDGFSCPEALFATGILVLVNSNHSVSYTAWYASSPSHYDTFADPIDMSTGDTLKLSVNAWTPTSATFTIDNLTNGQVVSKSLNSSSPLCGKDAEWGIQGFGLDGRFDILADFGTVTITDAAATGEKTWPPSAAQIVDMEQNNKVLTNVKVNETSVTIQYL